ncbi:hypothetical protein FQN55_007987 [Onygenales sp. PD_40]|nr:hypothetical protein FQN55_007987 [Onygenales sp. PD_40]
MGNTEDRGTRSGSAIRRPQTSAGREGGQPPGENIELQSTALVKFDRRKALRRLRRRFRNVPGMDPEMWASEDALGYLVQYTDYREVSDFVIDLQRWFEHGDIWQDGIAPLDLNRRDDRNVQGGPRTRTANIVPQSPVFNVSGFDNPSLAADRRAQAFTRNPKKKNDCCCTTM